MKLQNNRFIFNYYLFYSERDTGAYTAKASTGAEVTTCTAQLVVGQGMLLLYTHSVSYIQFISISKHLYISL